MAPVVLYFAGIALGWSLASIVVLVRRTSAERVQMVLARHDIADDLGEKSRKWKLAVFENVRGERPIILGHMDLPISKVECSDSKTPKIFSLDGKLA